MEKMPLTSSRDKDLEEIFLHVKKLKMEYSSIEEINKQTINEIIQENFLKEDKIENVDQDESTSKMRLITSGICDLCGQDFIFNENLSGLILLNKFFACEECCNDASNEILNIWLETRNAKLEEVKPIALWLMQIENKSRLI